MIEPLVVGLLLIPAIAVRIAVRALYGHQHSRSADPLNNALLMSSTVMMWLAGLATVIGLFGALILFLPVSLVLIALAFMVLDRTRRSQHAALISSLAVAAERGIPMPEAARAFADETQGDTGARSLSLARHLEAGRPLSDAAAMARLRMGSALRLAIRLGERLGVLGPAMRQQIDDTQQADGAIRDAIGRMFYLGNVILIFGIINSFLMIKVVPIFERMLLEFDILLPSMTTTLISISVWFAKVGSILFMPFSLLLISFLFASLLYFAGWFPRGLPLVWALTKRYDGALVMRGLALAIRRGVPLPTALDAVADSYPISMAVGRLRRASHEIAAGRPWCEALRRTRLIGSADAAVLAAAERTGNLPWALEQMADSALRRQAQRVQALVNLGFPIVVLMVAWLVMFFVVGLFLPLVELIVGLS